MDDFLTAIGLVMIFEGVPYFLSPKRMREWVERLATVSDMALRRVGLLMMTIGLLVIYMVRG
ncbi:MAG: DUF2065 domain-containing protein [Magnetococcales bacterium]|nr:DUF2065 domain-containing protein [Magnetococcales bacterium]